MLNEQQFGKMKNQQSSNPAIKSNGKSFKQAKLPKFQTPEEKILDNAKIKRLNAAAYKDQELGRLAHFESLKLRSQKEEEKRKKPTKK